MSEHWSTYTSNPNDPGVRLARAHFLRSIIQPRPEDRIEKMCELARGRRVLDVGCVNHESDAEAEGTWLHKRIARAASECMGIDILAREIQDLRERGYNVVVHDLSTSPVDDQYDVITCGEVVEHVGNVADFLEHCRASLRIGGELVVTTPFPWFIGSVLRNVLRGALMPGSVDHVAWYDPSTISELAVRHGFELKEICGVRPLPRDHGNPILEVFYGAVRRGVIPVLSRLSGCRSLLYRLERVA